MDKFFNFVGSLTSADVLSFISIILVLWKTFFSKGDIRKLKAESAKLESEAVKAYEESAKLMLERVDKLEGKLLLYASEKEKLEKKVEQYIKENETLLDRIKKLEQQIERRDIIIDCLSRYYKNLAEKAKKAGIENVDDVPCFDLPDNL